MNRFLMTNSNREMRVALKYYLNNHLQLLFSEKLKNIYYLAQKMTC